MKHRRIFRFSVRTMLVLLTLLCVWLGVQVNRARTQRKLVEWVEQNGGRVDYHHIYEWTGSDNDSMDTFEYYAPGPQWLRDLVGEEYFFNLRRIDLRSPHPGLQDVSMLRYARNVRDLDLWRNEVTDFSPVGRVGKLENLGLVLVPIEDLSFLSGLEHLRSVNICYTEKLTDISALGQIPSMRSIRLNRTSVTDLSSLEDLTDLESLRVQIAPLRDISPVAKLVGLQWLSLQWTNVDDLQAVRHLSQLEALLVDASPVHDLSPLQSLPGLKRLNAGGTNVSDLRPLSGLSWIEHLGLSETTVSDITPLADLKRLSYLRLNDTQVSDISVLASLPQLKFVDLKGTLVSTDEIAKLRAALPNCNIAAD